MILDQHNCATELKSVLNRIMKENEYERREKQHLMEENKSLLQHVENIAEKIENMEGKLLQGTEVMKKAMKQE